MTGSIPGNAASTGETWVLGSAPKRGAAPENSFAWLTIWACTSSPITVSHCPLPPSIMESTFDLRTDGTHVQRRRSSSASRVSLGRRREISQTLLLLFAFDLVL